MSEFVPTREMLEEALGPDFSVKDEFDTWLIVEHKDTKHVGIVNTDEDGCEFLADLAVFFDPPVSIGDDNEDEVYEVAERLMCAKIWPSFEAQGFEIVDHEVSQTWDAHQPEDKQDYIRWNITYPCRDLDDILAAVRFMQSHDWQTYCYDL